MTLDAFRKCTLIKFRLSQVLSVNLSGPLAFYVPRFTTFEVSDALKRK